MPGLQSDINHVRLLANGQTLNAQKEGNDVQIALPLQCPDTINTVIVVDCVGEPNILSNVPKQDGSGTVVIPGKMINIYNKSYDKQAYMEGKGDAAYVNDWEADRVFVDALFDLQKGGKFNLLAEIATLEKGGKLRVKYGDQIVEYAIPNTSDGFRWVNLGSCSFENTGINTLELHPVRGEWIPVKLRALKLEPMYSPD